MVRSVALALVIPVGGSCCRQDSRNGDNLVVPRFALRPCASPHHRKLGAGYAALPQMAGRRVGCPYRFSPQAPGYLPLRHCENPSGPYAYRGLPAFASLSMAGRSSGCRRLGWGVNLPLHLRPYALYDGLDAAQNLVIPKAQDVRNLLLEPGLIRAWWFIQNVSTPIPTFPLQGGRSVLWPPRWFEGKERSASR